MFFIFSFLIFLPFFFFFNDPPTTEIYTLSLHDALPILFIIGAGLARKGDLPPWLGIWAANLLTGDRKSTRLNSSHRCISYAVFCLKKKKKKKNTVKEQGNK